MQMLGARVSTWSSAKLSGSALPLLWSKSLQPVVRAAMYKEEAGPRDSCTAFIPLHSSPHPPAVARTLWGCGWPHGARHQGSTCLGTAVLPPSPPKGAVLAVVERIRIGGSGSAPGLGS